MGLAHEPGDLQAPVDAAPPLLRLHLLGGFRAVRDAGPPLPSRWSRPSAQALVKLLAVSPGHRLHREEVREICWPHADAEAATGSLRVALHAARRALEPELAARATSSYLVSDGAMLLLHPGRVWIDVDAAESLASKALAGKDDGPPEDALEQALTAFTGELLPEDRYADWASGRREQLAELRSRLLLALADARLAAGAWDAAADAARQALSDAPADEHAHQVVMTALLSRGLRRQAVRQYALCRDAMATELAVEPGPETERLHRQALRSGPSPSREASPSPGLPLPPVPAAADLVQGTTLHGREVLLRALTDADGPRVRVLGGEAGVGKTRLAAEAARRAADSGSAVLWGAAHDAEGRPPYGPFVEALDAWLSACSEVERARVSTEYPELVPLMPSLGAVTRSQPVPGAEAIGSEEERARLFHVVESLLSDLAAEHGVLLVLDDLHAADTGSHQLLARLARRAADPGSTLDCLILVTYRDDEPAAEADVLRLEELVRRGLAQRVPVPRLEREDCLALTRDVLTGQPDSAQQRVWELSLGNPLFALELARALPVSPETVLDPGQDPAPDPGHELPPPEGVRQLVAQRLARVGDDARRMTEVVAGAGGAASLAEVMAVARDGLHPPLAEPAATAALEEAVTASLLLERPVVVGGRTLDGLAFRHPLVRLTCYGLLTGVRRRRLHAAWAEAVLAHRPGDVDSLATHLASAGDPRAAHYLRVAAERAAALFANDSADAYYRRLDDLLPEDVDAAEARLAWGLVLHRMSRYADAAEILGRAFDTAHHVGDRNLAVLITARRTEALVKAGRRDDARRAVEQCSPDRDTPAAARSAHALARAVLLFTAGQHAAAVDPAAESARAAADVDGRAGARARARALALQASALGLAGRLADSQRVAEQARVEAETGDDPGTLAVVLSILRENGRRSGRLQESVRHGEHALELAERAGDVAAAAFERTNLAELHLLLDHREVAEQFAAAAEASSGENATWSWPYALAGLARARTAEDPASAAELLQRGEEAAHSTGDRQAQEEVRLAGAELALMTGDPTAVAPLLDGIPASPRADCLLAWSLTLGGRHADAVRLVDGEPQRLEREGQFLLAVETGCVLGHALAFDGDAARAAASFDHAAQLADELPYPQGQRRLAWARRQAATTQVEEQSSSRRSSPPGS